MTRCPNCHHYRGGNPQYRCHCQYRCLACGALCGRLRRDLQVHLQVRHGQRGKAEEIEAGFRLVNYSVEVEDAADAE